MTVGGCAVLRTVSVIPSTVRGQVLLSKIHSRELEPPHELYHHLVRQQSTRDTCTGSATTSMANSRAIDTVIVSLPRSPLKSQRCQTATALL
ncbi:hypothetical protein BC629DRAFT_1081311 [Irpex lacteus]|nr:hypothetical protein BC629DRAFT_1081311 [Irpex lacteus]